MTNSMKRVSILVAVAVVAVGIVGVTQRAQGEEKREAEDAARELLAASGVEKQLIPMMKQMVRLQAQALEGVGGGEVDMAIMDRWIDENIAWSDFEAGYVEIYVDLFTRDEMLELAAFQRSPVAQKSIELLPILMERGGQLGLRVVMEKMPKLEKMLEAADNIEEQDDVAF